MNSRAEDLLLNDQEAADYLSVKRHTLAIWRSTGRYNLPFVKLGRLVRYKKSDLDAFIERRTRGAEAA
jgi:excisionase family DNA binding protein